MKLLWAALIGAAALLATPASAAWRKAETANFILHTQEGEERAREQALLLEDYLQFLHLLTGVDEPPAPTKLRVYFVRDVDQLRVVRALRGNVGGFYIASPSGIAAFSGEGSSAMGSNELLFHEIAHHFMLQYRPTAYPAWFVEGFAEYVQTARFRPESIEYGQASMSRVQALSRLRWLPLEKLLFEPRPRDSRDAAIFYAQSWLLAHYLMRDDVRREKFRAYLNASAAGTPPREAFAAQFGDLSRFEREVESYARRGLTYTRLTRAAEAAKPAVTVATLPASADDLLLLEAALHVGQRGEFAAAALAKVRAKAAEHPGDAYAKRVLAMAEVLHGDGAAGEKLLDQLLAASPDDADLLYLMGMRHLVAGRADEAARAARFKDARTWFARAFKRDENHWQALSRYAETLSGTPEFNSDNTMNILLVARGLAPQVTELTMNTARLLLMRGRPEEARNLLRPLASSPHRPQLAAQAQALLAEAEAAAAGRQE